jgi:Acetyltransferase (GNAT) domain
MAIPQDSVALPDWLPPGFQAVDYFTHRLSAQPTAECFWQGFHTTTKKRLKKATGAVTTTEAQDLEQFTPLYRQFLYSKRMAGAPDRHLLVLKRIYDAVALRQQGYILEAQTATRDLAAINLIVWDAHTTYFIAGAANRMYANTHGHRVLFWKAIQDASKRGHAIDFCGGNVPSIGDFFQSFGAAKVPVFRALKYTPSWLRPIADTIRRNR